MKRTFALFTVLLLTAVCLCAAAAAETPAKRELILVTEYRQAGWSDRVLLGAVDNEGKLWTLEAEPAGDIPYGREELLPWAETADALEPCGTVSGDALADLKSLVQTVPAQELSYQSFACDAGEQTSFAVRRDRNGVAEIIVLGASGDDTFENTDPGAQALYKTLRELFPDVPAFAGEGAMAPAGFAETGLAAFCGYDGPALEELTMTAYANDCEAGSAATEPRISAEEIARMTVTGKKNSMAVTGNTVTYVFSGADGESAAAFEFFGDLLVRPDGMYSVRKGK